MAYEYEKHIKNTISTEAVFSHEKKKKQERVNELNEVYRKAKSWDALKELLIKEYPEVAHLAEVSNGEGERGEMSKHGEVLEHMDKLDGTNEFSNLLSDMEDE